VTIVASGGISGGIRPAVVVDSSGQVTLLDSLGHPICSGTLDVKSSTNDVRSPGETLPRECVYALPGNSDGLLRSDPDRCPARRGTVEGRPPHSYQPTGSTITWRCGRPDLSLRTPCMPRFEQQSAAAIRRSA